MNRILKAAAVVLAAGGGAVGCHSTGDRPGVDNRYAKYVDPCWPERYSYTARQEVLAPFAMHVNNSAIIEATLYNHYFEPESDKLNAGGLQRLDVIVRKRPSPDPKVYIQTARDIRYDAAQPEKFVSDRAELDTKRAQSVLRYLQAQTAARPVNFEVQVIDPSEPTIRADIIAGASRGLMPRFTQGAQGLSGIAGSGPGGTTPPLGAGVPPSSAPSGIGGGGGAAAGSGAGSSGGSPMGGGGASGGTPGPNPQ